MSSGDLRPPEPFSQRSLAPLRSGWRTTAYFFWMSYRSSNAMFGPALLHFFLSMLATLRLQRTTIALIFANGQTQKPIINFLRPGAEQAGTRRRDVMIAVSCKRL